jgi:hypothetical protein
MVAVVSVNLLSIIASAGIFIAVFVILSRHTSPERAVKSFVEASRWVLVGLIVGITATAYQSAELFGSQVLVAAISICLLMGAETYLSKFEDSFLISNETETTD